MTACEVIVWKNRTLEFSKIFVGKENGPSLGSKAEQFFKEVVRDYVDYPVSDEDFRDYIGDGFFWDDENDVEVIINFPLIEEVR